MDNKEIIALLDEMIDYVKSHIGSSHSDTGKEDEDYLQELINKKNALINLPNK